MKVLHLAEQFWKLEWIVLHIKKRLVCIMKKSFSIAINISVRHVCILISTNLYANRPLWNSDVTNWNNCDSESFRCSIDVSEPEVILIFIKMRKFKYRRMKPFLFAKSLKNLNRYLNHLMLFRLPLDEFWLPQFSGYTTPFQFQT